MNDKYRNICCLFSYKQFTCQSIQVAIQQQSTSIYNNIISMQPETQALLTIPPAPKTARGQTSFIQASPDFLLYFNGCTAILRSITNKTTLYINHLSRVTAVKFSYGYKQIASIDEKGTLMIHILQQNTKLILSKCYEGFFVGGKSIDWTSDNKRLAVVGSGKNKFGRVVFVESGTDVGDVSAVTATLCTVSIRPQKPYKMAVGGQQFTMKFYEGPPYKFVRSQKSHTNFINQVKHSPDGKKLISVGSDRKIILYDAMNNYQIQKQLAQAHEGGIMGITWIDNQTFITVSSDKKLKKWNLSLQLLATLASNEDQHELGLIDSFIVAVCYNVQTQTVYYVLLSGQIKSTDKNLTKINIGNSFQGYKNKAVKLIPLPNQKDSALLLDSGGKLLKINTNNTSQHRYLRNILCQNKLLIDTCISTSGICYYLTGDQIVSQFNINSAAQPQKIQSIKIQGARFITPINSTNNTNKSFACFTRNSIKIYLLKNDKYQKIDQIKLIHEPTYIYSDISNKNTDIIFIGNGKGYIQIFQIQLFQQSTKIAKLTQFHSNTNKITYIQKYNDLLFIGDTMGSIKVWKWSLQEQEGVKISESMGSHTTVISAILIKDNHIYTFSMDNKYSIWKLDNYQRLSTVAEVHKHGILCAEIIGGKIVTSGGDSLVKVHVL